MIARFLPGQRFDLQATIRLDAGTSLQAFEFEVDGVALKPASSVTSVVTTGLSLPAGTNAAVVSQRAYSNSKPGVHRLTVNATQSDGQRVSATGNFEVVALAGAGRKAKNIIILLGDGMGAAHRTAARIMSRGYAQGKAQAALAMDTFPNTGMVMTSSLRRHRHRLLARHVELRDRQQGGQQPGGRVPRRHGRCLRQPAHRVPVGIPAPHPGQGAGRGDHGRRVRRDAGRERRAHREPRQRQRHRRPVPGRPRPDRPDGADGRRAQVVPAEHRGAEGRRRAPGPGDERLAARREDRLRAARRPGGRLGRGRGRPGPAARPDRRFPGCRLRLCARPHGLETPRPAPTGFWGCSRTPT